MVGKQKLGGILTELSLGSNGNVEYAIIGIGINCSQDSEDFPTDIRDIATSLTLCTGNKIDRAAVIAAVLVSLEAMSKELQNPKETLICYRKDCITIGKDISLVRGDEIRHGRAVDVDEAGALVVEFPDGHRENINSGEVSVRGMYGYV